ncbi:TGS domain-containing protein, partial [Buchnera aphidicola (Hormaphis cornu)]
MPIITFLNGTTKFFKNEVSVLEIADTLKVGLSKLCIAAKVNELIVDANTLIDYDCHVSIITINDDKNLA